MTVNDRAFYAYVQFMIIPLWKTCKSQITVSFGKMSKITAFLVNYCICNKTKNLQTHLFLNDNTQGYIFNGAYTIVYNNYRKGENG